MMVVVIGSGIVGLATAYGLVSKEHQVTVFEKNAAPDRKNLHFVWGGVDPGGLIPLSLASTKIVDNEIPAS